MTVIFGIKLPNRISTSPVFQDIISKYGCIIRTRVGLHNDCNMCSGHGIILLEVTENADVTHLKEALLSIDGITIDSMTL